MGFCYKKLDKSVPASGYGESSFLFSFFLPKLFELKKHDLREICTEIAFTFHAYRVSFFIQRIYISK